MLTVRLSTFVFLVDPVSQVIEKKTQWIHRNLNLVTNLRRILAMEDSIFFVCDNGAETNITVVTESGPDHGRRFGLDIPAV